MNNTRYYNLDFVKFLSCLSILIVHAPLIGFDLIKERTDIGVSFFFILSGFFLFTQIKKDISYQDFVVKRYIRLMPIVILSFLFVFCLNYVGLITQETHFKDNFMTFFFIRNIALFNDATQIRFIYNNSHLWYLGPLFWVSLFYLSLFKIFPHKISTFIVAIMSYIGVMIYIHKVRVLPGLLGVWRGLFGIGLGILIRIFISYINYFQETRLIKKGTIIFFTILELLFFGIFIDLLFFNTLKLSEYAYGIVVFSILVILFFIQKGAFSRLLNQPFLGKLGIYSYSIYILQYIPQILFAKGNLLSNSKLYLHLKTEYPISTCLIISILFPCAFGIILYYMCEKKSYEKLSSLYNKIRSKYEQY